MAQFGAQLVTVSMTWPELKAIVTRKSMLLQYDESGEAYQVFAIDAPIVYTAIIFKGAVPYTNVETQDQNDSNKSDFEIKYKSRANLPLAPQTADGKRYVSMWPTEGSRANFITPNWCDKRTWYPDAARVVDEIAQPLGAGVYTLANSSLIDVYHGRISSEDSLKDGAGNSYRVSVAVNSIAKTEQDPHFGTGGDFTVDYAAGRIAFLTPPNLTDVVKATYHYARSSVYTLRPASGKILKIKSVEAQFSSDVVLTDSVVFQAYGYAAVFAPQLGLSAGTKIPLGSPSTYKTMMDYLNEANGAKPQIVAFGGAGWRGIQSSINVFSWDYQSMTDLVSSYGMEVRIRLEHDALLAGSAATATFYCLVGNES